eukprot:Platyproteum_vivax@DN6719_c0_g1_i1.p1
MVKVEKPDLLKKEEDLLINNSEETALPLNAEKYQRKNVLDRDKITSKTIGFRRRLEKVAFVQREAVRRLALSEVLLPQKIGYIEAEDDELSYDVTQHQILANAPQRVLKRIFNFDLESGPYKVDYSRNGRHMLVGGEVGHLTMIDTHEMRSLFELEVEERIRDVKMMHNFKLLGVAQEKCVHLYDNQGMELHCMKKMKNTSCIDFLPYHFLMPGLADGGVLRYLDITTGDIVATKRVKKCYSSGVMCTNPSNAAVCVGTPQGVVSMWTPNMDEEAVRMMCHRGPITAVACGHSGNNEYALITGGMDGSWKVWDLRKYGEVNRFWTGGLHASTIECSLTGVVGIGFGPHVQFWKPFEGDPEMPYLVHSLPGKTIHSLKLKPFEDVCAIGHSAGFGTMVVPGAGFANPGDSEGNVLESKKTRQNREVKQLLEKLPPDTISILKPGVIGGVDQAPPEVLEKEKEQVLFTWSTQLGPNTWVQTCNCLYAFDMLGTTRNRSEEETKKKKTV